MAKVVSLPAGQPRLEVGLYWGGARMEVRGFRPGETVVAGASRRAHFRIPDPRLGEARPVLLPDGTRFDLVVPEGVAWEVVRAGRRLEHGDAGEQPGSAGAWGGARVTLLPGDRARLAFGTLALVARYVHIESAARPRWWRALDALLLRVLAVSALVHVALLAMMAIAPKEEPLFEQWVKNPNHWVVNQVKRQQDLFKPVTAPPHEGKRAPGPEGQLGARRETLPRAAPPRGGPVVDVNKRERDREMVAKRLAWLGGLGPLAVPGIDTGDLKSRGLTPGGPRGAVAGFGGFGSRDLGPGGGGNPLDIGALGVPGGEPGGPGPLAGPAGREKETTPPPEREGVIEGDALPREVIARNIARHASEIRYCYERALKSEDPGLAGKVSLTFVIGPSGAVAEVAVKENTMGSNAVAECMTARVARWIFPAPRGGGIVQVTYPWVFKPAG